MMLSPLDDGRLLIILQIDHSRTAGVVAAHWGNQEFDPPWPYISVVVAGGGHDSAWWDWEIEPFLKASGEVIDYYRSNEVLGRTWLDFTNSWIERLAKRDPYAGFLVSMHHEGLLSGGFGTLPHMPDRRDEQVVVEFSRQQTTFRQQVRKQMEARDDLKSYLDDELVRHNYKLVQMFDQFGQILCNRHPFNSGKRETGPKTTFTHVPVRVGAPDTSLTIDIVSETEAVVRPWPFDTGELEIHVPARVLSRSRYEDHDEFLSDYMKADQVTVTRILRAP